MLAAVHFLFSFVGQDPTLRPSFEDVVAELEQPDYRENSTDNSEDALALTQASWGKDIQDEFDAMRRQHQDTLQQLQASNLEVTQLRGQIDRLQREQQENRKVGREKARRRRAKHGSVDLGDVTLRKRDRSGKM